jgi:iron complex outermembrane recepter protein
MSCQLPALLMGLLAATMAQAQGGSGERVVVTGSLREQAVAEAPFAIGVVDAEALRSAGPMVNLSEALVRVPGLVVANRSNFAQDLQISSRGFGARAGFGVRGLRLVSDGIPATMPDGQGQVAHFDLAGAERIEVLRGPFSVLYGNSSGGVIALFSAPVKAAEAEAAADAGSFGLRQLRAAVGLPVADGLDLRLSAATLESEGFRPQSRARRTLGHLRLAWRDGSDRVVFSASGHDQPAQDPLGLTRAQFDADPRQTTPQATQFNTRKTARQQQAGLSWQHRFAGDGALRESQLAAFIGERSVAQWLAIAAATQANPRHGGGVIDFDRRFGGIDGRLRWAWPGVDLLAGVALERQSDDRKGFENFSGSPAVLGSTGRLRREEVNTASTRDGFVQAEWSPARNWAVSSGVRSGRVELQAQDAYLSNGDDSGRLVLRYTNPVLGLRWQAAPLWQWHASVARGFESPTLGELAYRSDGVGGFNSALGPQVSRQLEVGSKWRDPSFSVDAALFAVAVADEIAIATNEGGRSSFRNIGRTTRRGAELALGWQPAGPWRAALTLTALDAQTRDFYLACAGVPCTTPTVPVPPGSQLGGTQKRSGFAELAWRSAAWGEFGVEVRGQSRTAVNDANSEFAPGFGLLGLRWSRRTPLGAGMSLETLLRVDNLGDKVHAASVIVGDANRRFYESGAPRALLLSLRWLYGR